MNVVELERARVIKQANSFLDLAPTTITAMACPRSPGGAHDYYSEGDYWWQNPDDPNGPYIRRDGYTNPDAFFGHRRLVMALSVQVAALASAYKITRDEKYAAHAIAHLRAWFVTPETRMNPHLEFAQAIQGICTGRGVGIIDTTQLVEVALAIEALRDALGENFLAVRAWFADYLTWVTTHPYGIDESAMRNNHATAWVLQVAAFAHLVGDENTLADCRRRYKEILLPNQMANDGSFPHELRRTKPYGYSVFNLELMTALCQLLSTSQDDVWRFTTSDGRTIRRGMEFLYPYLQDKETWPYARDVMRWEGWPSQPSSLLFTGVALDEPRFVELWRALSRETGDEEITRNTPIRQPVLWF